MNTPLSPVHRRLIQCLADGVAAKEIPVEEGYSASSTTERQKEIYSRLSGMLGMQSAGLCECTHYGIAYGLVKLKFQPGTKTWAGKDEILSDQEIEVLKCVAMGRTNEETAQLLSLEKKDGNRLRNSIIAKLRLKFGLRFIRVSEFVHYAIARGHIENMFKPEPSQAIAS